MRRLSPGVLSNIVRSSQGVGTNQVSTGKWVTTCVHAAACYSSFKGCTALAPAEAWMKLEELTLTETSHLVKAIDTECGILARELRRAWGIVWAQRFSFAGWRVLEMADGDGYLTVWMHWMPLNCSMKHDQVITLVSGALYWKERQMAAEQAVACPFRTQSSLLALRESNLDSALHCCPLEASFMIECFSFTPSSEHQKCA